MPIYDFGKGQIFDPAGTINTWDREGRKGSWYRLHTPPKRARRAKGTARAEYLRTRSKERYLANLENRKLYDQLEAALRQGVVGYYMGTLLVEE